MARPGDTTQFLFVPHARPRTRRYIIALASGFWTFCLGCTVLSVLFDIIGSGSLLTLIGSPVVVAAALVPNILLALLIPRLQRHQRTHRYVLIGAFLAGAIVAIPPALILNTLLFAPAELFGAQLLAMGTIPGVVEEGIKGAVLLFIFFVHRDQFHDPVDGVVIGALIGLGFAMTEDISYFLRGLSSGGVAGLVLTIFLRVLLGWMNHSVFTASFGAALGFARMGPPGVRRVALGVGGYAVAAGLHNTFDFMATLLNQLAPANLAGLLIKIVPLYGLTWTAAAVLGFIVAHGWHREAQLIREELLPEVATGVVTPEEYAALPDTGRRRALLREAAAHGKDARSRLGKLFQLEIALALQRRHAAYGDRPGVPELHSVEALRARIRALRAPTAAAPWPPLPTAPPPLPRPAAPLRLTVMSGAEAGASAPLAHGLTIGRNPARAAFVLRDPQVSGLHARVEQNGGLPILVDAGSTNGTYVNAQRVTRQILRPGDHILLGASDLVVTSDER
jgi:RsiW-degrading membrane proteinase PrsW (M82 family)